MLEISGKHPEKNDEELLGQFRDSGSLDILGELYARYMHLVYGVSLKYLEDRSDAQDAVMQMKTSLFGRTAGKDGDDCDAVSFGDRDGQDPDSHVVMLPSVFGV